MAPSEKNNLLGPWVWTSLHTGACLDEFLPISVWARGFTLLSWLRDTLHMPSNKTTGFSLSTCSHFSVFTHTVPSICKGLPHSIILSQNLIQSWKNLSVLATVGPYACMTAVHPCEVTIPLFGPGLCKLSTTYRYLWLGPQTTNFYIQSLNWAHHRQGKKNLTRVMTNKCKNRTENQEASSPVTWLPLNRLCDWMSPSACLCLCSSPV